MDSYYLGNQECSRCHGSYDNRVTFDEYGDRKMTALEDHLWCEAQFELFNNYLRVLPLNDKDLGNLLFQLRFYDAPKISKKLPSYGTNRT